MKKILFVFILITSVVYAQEYTVTPDGLRDNSNADKTYVVINTPGKTAGQNYNNAIKYINKTYKSPKDVIKGDVEGEYISFNTHVSDFLFVKNSGVKVVIDANYTIELSFKDERVKFEVINLDMYNPEVNSKVLFQGSVWSGFPIYKKKKNKLIRPETKTDIEVYFNNTINNIKGFLLEEIKVTDDDW
tara:strand:+ start:210 stop:773 length:564 start_codon:yes stop_codon:yes gene_type:complete